MLGSIINLSSITAQATRPELLGYSMAAAAMDQMTRSLAVALAPKGIRVNAVAFGSVMSASLQAALKENPDYRDEITGHAAWPHRRPGGTGRDGAVPCLGRVRLHHRAGDDGGWRAQHSGRGARAGALIIPGIRLALRDDRSA